MTTGSEIKVAEIQMNNKFNWNFAFRTPYDYLETFLSIGVVLLNDNLSPDSPFASPMSEARGPAPSPESVVARQGQSPGGTHQKQQPNLEGQPSPAYNSSKLHMTPSTAVAKPLAVGSLTFALQTELRRKIRDACLEIVERMATQAYVNPDEHKTAALAVVVAARSINRIQENA